jgi:hypothetical protein
MKAATVVLWVLCVFLVLLWIRDGAQYTAEIKRLEQIRDSLAAVARGRDTLYVAQVDTLRILRTRTDSIVLVDTLIHRDTVVRIIARERDACDAVIATCEARVADRDRQIANLDSLLKTEKKRGGADWKTKLGLILGGAAAGVLIVK